MGKPRTICPTYWIGDVVFLKVDEEGEVGMITRVSIAVNDSYLYMVSWADARESLHFDIELDLVMVEEKADA